MEVYSFIHKETKEIIRFNKIYVDDEICIQHYFSDDKDYAIWFNENKNDLERITKGISEWESFDYRYPCTDRIKIKDYEICKFSLCI